jgi:hypothetical protein
VSNNNFTINEKFQAEHNWKNPNLPLQSPHKLLLFLQNCRQNKRTSEQWIVTAYNKDTKPKKCGTSEIIKVQEYQFPW